MAVFASQEIRDALSRIQQCESALHNKDELSIQLEYADALAHYEDVGGYELERRWDYVTHTILGMPLSKVWERTVTSLSGGELKKLILAFMFEAPEKVLLLDEADNALDIIGKLWLEKMLSSSPKTVLLVSHDRELLNSLAPKIFTLELANGGNSGWIFVGSFSSYLQERKERIARLEEEHRRIAEKDAQLVSQVEMYQTKAHYNSNMSSRLKSARSQLARFRASISVDDIPQEQVIHMRHQGGRTGSLVVSCRDFLLSNTNGHFSLNIYANDRVCILGENGTGKSTFLTALFNSASEQRGLSRRHTDKADIRTIRIGSRVIPGYLSQTRQRPEFSGQTLVEILNKGDSTRNGIYPEDAEEILALYALESAQNQSFASLSGGQKVRFELLLLELSGINLLLLDEPTDNLDLASCEALETSLATSKEQS